MTEEPTITPFASTFATDLPAFPGVRRTSGYTHFTCATDTQQHFPLHFSSQLLTCIFVYSHIKRPSKTSFSRSVLVGGYNSVVPFVSLSVCLRSSQRQRRKYYLLAPLFMCHLSSQILLQQATYLARVGGRSHPKLQACGS